MSPRHFGGVGWEWDRLRLDRKGVASPAFSRIVGSFGGVCAIGSQLKVLAKGIGATRGQNELVGFRIDRGHPAAARRP